MLADPNYLMKMQSFAMFDVWIEIEFDGEPSEVKRPPAQLEIPRSWDIRGSEYAIARHRMVWKGLVLAPLNELYQWADLLPYLPWRNI